ncbi:hypothetical protein D9M68_518300 [compost metagenome]
MNPFDWQRIFLDEFPLAFLGEVILRSLCAFILVFAFLRLSGRRGVRQLSLFEVLVILTLGSAAGDVYFYEDVPLLPILAMFATLLCLYRLTEVVKQVAQRLGNSPAICRKCYIHPAIVEAFIAGELADSKRPRKRKRLSAEEIALLKFLEAREGSA